MYVDRVYASRVRIACLSSLLCPHRSVDALSFATGERESISRRPFPVRYVYARSVCSRMCSEQMHSAVWIGQRSKRIEEEMPREWMRPQSYGATAGLVSSRAQDA